MHDIQDKSGVRNMTDLTIKAIKSIYDTETPSKEHIKKYKRYGKECIAGSTGIYIREDLAFKIIMYSTVPTSLGFKSKLGFNPYDPIMRKEQSVLTKVMKVFAREEILLQHYVLGYRINLYFLKHKLAIETDEKRHKDRNK